MNADTSGYRIELAGVSLDLPLIGGTPSFYVLDLSGQAKLNRHFANALNMRAGKFDYHAILTVEGKGIGLTQEMAREHGRYAVMRKTCPPYLQNPLVVGRIASLTTQKMHDFYLGRDTADWLRGKSVLLVDDVLSTGGTANAMLEMCKIIGAIPAAFAVVLTEGEAWSEYGGVPVVSLGHIPLPPMRV
ncbi:MAG: adenine phosphoribosyltransferase [Clostridiales Family XIII bacterium]|jgi:adenine phosphoribosyltransferase|nr:adenine phosphoribosyltransferase [Clostridiales Family XIII bacterium]